MRYFFHYGIAKILPGILNYLIIIISIRGLSPEVYGEYSYILSLITLICSFLFPWIRLNINRNYAESKKKDSVRNNFINLSFTLYLFTSLIFMVIILFIYRAQEEKTLVLWGAVSLLTLYYFDQQTTYLRADLESKIYMEINLLKSVVRFISFIGLFVYFNYGATAIFIALFVSNVIPLIVYRKKLPYSPKQLNFNINKTVEFFNYGFPLMLSSLLVYVISSNSRIFLKHYSSVSEVGIFSAYFDSISFLFTTVLILINMSFFPIMIKEFNKSEKEISKYVKISKMYSHSSLMTSVFIFGCLLLFSEQYHSLLLNMDNDTKTLFYLILISVVINGVKSYLLDTNFHMSKKTKLQTISIVVAAVLNVVMNFILIPSYGAIGAAVSSLISVSAGAFVSIYFIQKEKFIFIDLKRNIISYMLFIGIILGFKGCLQICPIEIFTMQIIVFLFILTFYLYNLKQNIDINLLRNVLNRK